jgi:hypothetical protein
MERRVYDLDLSEDNVQGNRALVKVAVKVNQRWFIQSWGEDIKEPVNERRGSVLCACIVRVLDQGAREEGERLSTWDTAMKQKRYTTTMVADYHYPEGQASICPKIALVHLSRYMLATTARKGVGDNLGTREARPHAREAVYTPILNIAFLDAPSIQSQDTQENAEISTYRMLFLPQSLIRWLLSASRWRSSHSDISIWVILASRKRGRNRSRNLHQPNRRVG